MTASLRLLFLGTLLWQTSSCSSGVEAQPYDRAHFQELILSLSEEPGYFDTDNLISNESSYLHVIPDLAELSVPGQVYLGVGPDQNFTYILHTRPQLAFILDLRRDNLLLHLYYKSLFEQARDRWEFLSLLFGAPRPEGLDGATSAGVQELVRIWQSQPRDPDFFQQTFRRVWEHMRTQFPRLVGEEDRATVYKMAWAFHRERLGLRYRSHGRPPRRHYPSFGELLTERDARGKPANYLNREEDFQYLRRLQVENRILPLVGNFSGREAFPRLAAYLRQRGLSVSAFYVSNVEFYLFRDASFPRFVENVARLPIHGRTLFIRSCFTYWRPHPESRPGYYVTSFLQPIRRFLEEFRRRPYVDYWDLVTRDYLLEVRETSPPGS